MSFIVQRKGDGRKSWHDLDTFDSKAAAVRARDFDLASQHASIRGAGGENWSGRRVRPLRIVETVS